MPSQDVLDGLSPCLSLQERQAVKILMILTAFVSFNQTNCKMGGSLVRYNGLRKPGQNMGWGMARAEGAVGLGLGRRGEWGLYVATNESSKLVPHIFVFHLVHCLKTWPRLGVGDGQGCRGDGVGQGAGMWSIDSTDHQKPGESCWRERRGMGYGIIWRMGAEENKDGRFGINMERVADVQWWKGALSKFEVFP